MKRKDAIAFYVQYIIGRVLVFVTIPLIVLAIKVAGYRVKEMARLRKKVKQMTADHPGPWLICPNHLTMIDSVILAYAFIPPWKYLFQYRKMPWNVPELMNFKRNPLVVLTCFLNKCLPLVRGGDREALNAVMSKCRHLLKKGDSLVIFPEGTRARSGRVNTQDFPYGAGRFFMTVPDIRVMCVYLRGRHQTLHSALPRYRERFYMAIETFTPETGLKGLRAQRELSGQIINRLARMEEHYFAACGK
jgi:1-acyl-sn-glycerol-3-phosphate acyltransferase